MDSRQSVIDFQVLKVDDVPHVTEDEVLATRSET
jgi:hypothetical protein